MKNFFKMLTALLAVASLTSCSGSGGTTAATPTASELKIAGTLGTTARMAAGENAEMAVTLSDLEIYALAFTTPPVIARANVAADGSFSVELPGAKGTSVTAIFRDTTDNSAVGTIVFEDTSSKDLNGNSSKSSSIVLSDSVSLGNITLGTDGKVTVPISQIAASVGTATTVAAATAFDPTGTWYMKAFDGTLPTGYQTVSTTCGSGNPCVGFPLTMYRMAGKKFTPVTNCTFSNATVTCASTDGTIGTEDRYAFSIWGGTFATGVGACGSKIGFSAAEARAGGRIHLTTLPSIGGNPLAFGDYVYTASTGFGGDSAPFNLPWMKTGAVSSRALQNCRPMPIVSGGTTYNGWGCKSQVMTGTYPGTGAGTYGWNVGIEGGGCFNTATQKPVNVTNWSTLGFGTCTTTDVSSTYGTGFKKNTCTYSNVDHDSDPATAAISLACTNTGGQFTDSSGPTATPMTYSTGQYLGQPITLAAAGATCASIGSATAAATLAAYRCYAEAYWSANKTGNCQREYNFNWAATSALDFAQDDGRGKPKMAFITNIANYATDGQSAVLEDEDTNKIALSTGPNSSTFCEVSRRTVINFKKISDSRLLLDLRQSGQMNSTSAACLGAAKDAAAGKQVPGGGDLAHTLSADNMMFYVDTTL